MLLLLYSKIQFFYTALLSNIIHLFPKTKPARLRVFCMQYCFLFFAEKAFDEGGNVALLFGFDNVLVRRFFKLFNGFLRAVKV